MRSKIKPDLQKAISLVNMAKITRNRLDLLDKLKYPSNTLNDYYDILHKLMEAYVVLKGLKFRGENAHKELIDYVCEILFSSQDRIFFTKSKTI